MVELRREYSLVPSYATILADLPYRRGVPCRGAEADLCLEAAADCKLELKGSSELRGSRRCDGGGRGGLARLFVVL